MSQLGERLRDAREEQGISLPQAAADTRILQRYLVALEAGEYEHLPGDVYARGFLRNYGDYLGLSVEELIDQYRRERGATEQIRVVPASRPPRIQGCMLPSMFTVFFVVTILIGATYFYLSASGVIGEPPAQQAAEPTAGPATPAPLPTLERAAAPTLAAGVAEPTPDMALPPTPAPTPQPSPTQSAPVVVEVRIKPGNHQGSWMRIEADGGQVFQGIMTPGQVQLVEAQRQVAIRAGNAGVVEVSANGQPPLTLGQEQGQVVDWIFPP
jgi:transcriptional regulator with XRE-family HTH domain